MADFEALLADALARAVEPLTTVVVALRNEVTSLRVEVAALRAELAATSTKTEPTAVYVTTRQAAQRYGISIRTVKRMVQSGELPALRVRGRLRIPLAEAERVLRQTAATVAEAAE